MYVRFEMQNNNKMNTYVNWLERQIDRCLEDKDLQREHWAFCKALEKFMELQMGADNNFCTCSVVRGTPIMNGKYVCSVCNKQIV